MGAAEVRGWSRGPAVVSRGLFLQRKDPALQLRARLSSPSCHGDNAQDKVLFFFFLLSLVHRTVTPATLHGVDWNSCAHCTDGENEAQAIACGSTRAVLGCTGARPPVPFHLAPSTQGGIRGVIPLEQREASGKTRRLDQRSLRLCLCLRTCCLLRIPERSLTCPRETHSPAGGQNTHTCLGWTFRIFIYQP